MAYAPVIGWLLVLVLIVVWYFAYTQYDDVLKYADTYRSEVFIGLSAYLLVLGAVLAGLVQANLNNPLTNKPVLPGAPAAPGV